MSNSILIIDDERDLRLLLAKTLEYEGYEVLTADRGKAGFQLLKDHAVQVVITEVKLPDSNGIQLTQNIREISPETEVTTYTRPSGLSTTFSPMPSDMRQPARKSYWRRYRKTDKWSSR